MKRINKAKKLWLALPLALALLLTACSATHGVDKEIDATAASQLASNIVDEEIAQLYDDYAAYYTETEFKIMMEDYEGAFGGIGLSMLDVDGDIVV